MEESGRSDYKKVINLIKIRIVIIKETHLAHTINLSNFNNFLSSS